MKENIIRIGLLFLVVSANLAGQAVNETIDVLLTQAAQLRVNAGYDMDMEEDGTVVIGTSVYTFGGTPEFSYEWRDQQDHYYYEKSTEVSITGDYFLTVTDQKNCSASDTLTVFPFGTGFFLANEIAELQISFNPENSSLRLSSPEPMKDPVLRIISMNGSVLFDARIEQRESSDIYTVELDLVQPGMYLVYMQGKQNMAAAKFIVR